MGANMALRLRRANHDVVVWNRNAQTTRELVQDISARGAASVGALVRAPQPPRIVWLMLPAGDVT